MDDPSVMNCVNRYQDAHFRDAEGYQPWNHNLMREDVIQQMYEYALIFQKSFTRAGWNQHNIPSKKVLEIGSAWGLRLNQLLAFNFSPENLYGIDLQEEYIRQAQRSNPLIHHEVMSATQIGYPDRFFDAALACVVLQAMLDPETIDRTLSELCRVTRDFVLVVDIFDPRYTAERNGSVYLKGVDFGHLQKLKALPTVADVLPVGSFWTMNTAYWRLYRLLNRLGLSAVSYALAVRLLAKHSHQAYLIRLRNAPPS